MSRSQRDKGARGERLLKEFLNGFGLGVKRGYVFLHQSDLVGLPGIHVECKFVEKLNVRQALKQATEEAKIRNDGAPTVFWKVSRLPWITVMWTKDWCELYRRAYDAGTEGTGVHEKPQGDNGS